MITFTGMLCLCSVIGKTQQTDHTLSAGNKIFIHTDKEQYLAGELLWFKTYLLEPGSNRPLHQEAIIYVELFNNKGRSLLQAKIPWNTGRKDGNFYLPADLNTGSYLMVSYTATMKNAGPAGYFRKRIDIINTLKPLPVSITEKNNNRLFAGLYPEGGSIIAGVSTKFGLYIMDPSSGKGMNARGVIVNQKNDTITTFQTAAFGMTQVRFAPVETDRYAVIVQLSDNSTFRKEIMLPKAENYALAIDNNQGDRVKITTMFNNAEEAGGREKLRLLIHARQTSKAVIEIEADNGKVNEYFIDKNRLGTGVTYFTLLNSKGQPVCERLMFIQPSASKAQVNISFDKKDITRRESFDIDLRFSGSAADTLNGSLAIIPAKNGDERQLSSIYEYVLLGADVPGNIENPEFYFTERSLNDPSLIENLMLVNGWRQFSSAAADPKSIITCIPEYHGHIVTARVSDTWSNLPQARVSCTLTVPSSPFGYYTALSDTNGIVRFNVQHYFGPGTAIIKAISTIKPNPFKIEILSPFDQRLSGDITLPELQLTAADSATLAQRSLAMQTLNTFQHDEINHFTAPVLKDTFPFYGKPEYSYLLDDYTRFSTMEEVLREYVAPIAVALRGSKLTMSVYNEKQKVSYDDFMLVLLDGVPLSDPNQIFNYDPYKVKKIDVVPRRYLYGSSQYYGIASFETYNGQFDATELDPSSLLVDYEGLQLKREFFTPVYTSEDKGDPRVPDLRSTLLWMPNIDLTNDASRKIKAYSSDFSGSFRVVFCGVSSSGIPVQQVEVFSVK